MYYISTLLQVVFVRSNNVFIRNVAPGQPETQITADGEDRRRDGGGEGGSVQYGLSIDELYSPDPMEQEHSSRDLKVRLGEMNSLLSVCMPWLWEWTCWECSIDA